MFIITFFICVHYYLLHINTSIPCPGSVAVVVVAENDELVVGLEFTQNLQDV